MPTAVDFAPRSSGHNMLGAMARPLNGWVHEPSHARRDGCHGQDHQSGQAGRLLGPSCLPSGPPRPPLPPPPSTGSGRDQAPGKDAYCYDRATPSPIQQPSPQTPLHGGGARTSAMQWQPPPLDARPSPAQSPAASDRSDEVPGGIAGQQQRNAPARQPLQSRVPRLLDPLQLRGGSEASRHHYATVSGRASQTASPTGHFMPSPRPAARSMSIANLLAGDDKPGGPKSDSKAPARPRPETTGYRIVVRQQPVAARSCGFGERDRRVIDPPPIVQLLAEEPGATPEALGSRIRVSSAVVHCSIWNEAGDRDSSAMPEDYRQQRRLMGTLVSSPFVGLDESGREGCFFCFPDLSCRTPGSFRLRFALIILDVGRPLRPGSRSPIVATAMSGVFAVYNAKDFPGMTASTALTRRLREQGCLISIKKGNERAGSARGRGDSDDEDEGAAADAGRQKRARKS